MAINKVNELKVVLRVDSQHGQGHGHGWWQRKRSPSQAQARTEARSGVAPPLSRRVSGFLFVVSALSTVCLRSSHSLAALG